MTLEVVEPGLLTTIQDLGRPETTHLGVPVGGAADRWSLAVANRLVDAAPSAPALEATLVGPTLRALEDVILGIAGADLGGVERETGRPLLPGRSYAIEAGRTVAFPGPRDPARVGCRAYLAVAGGLAMRRELGAAATLPAAGLGGLGGGRALVPGDRLRPARPLRVGVEGRIWPGPTIAPRTGRSLRIVRGPAAGVEQVASLAALVAAEWRVAASSDRTGARLDGPPLATTGPSPLSHGVPDGAIQAPPDGRPIVLLADHGTTGGYPVVAVVIAADIPAAGQLRPGDPVRLAEVSIAEARDALVEQDRAWRAASAALGDVDGWDELWRSAGG